MKRRFGVTLPFDGVPPFGHGPLVDALVVHGPPERCREGLARFADAGVVRPAGPGIGSVGCQSGAGSRW